MNKTITLNDGIFNTKYVVGIGRTEIPVGGDGEVTLSVMSIYLENMPQPIIITFESVEERDTAYDEISGVLEELWEKSTEQ